VEVRIVPVPASLALAAGTVLEKAWRGLRLRGEPPVTRFAAEHLATAHWFDISAARRDLGYAPAVTLDEGFRRLARWHEARA
jgi:nucleoside-diphosphate-sugar epimerase